MEERLTSIKYKLSKILRGHQAFVALLIFLLVLTLSVLRINSLSNKPADQSYVLKKKAEIKSVRFNEQAIEQIKQLSNSNVKSPGTNLPANRQNPFSE